MTLLAARYKDADVRSVWEFLSKRIHLNALIQEYQELAQGGEVSVDRLTFLHGQIRQLNEELALLYMDRH